MKYVADASAVLALFQQERVTIDIAAALAESTISAINLCEVVSKLLDAGQSFEEAMTLIDTLGLPVVPLDATLAMSAAQLRHTTREIGLSLGDRCCLATAKQLKLPALTGDRDWVKIEDTVGINVVLIR